MKDQSLAIRARELQEQAAERDERMTTEEAVRKVWEERGLPEAALLDLVAKLTVSVALDPRPTPVPEPSSALFDTSEPLRIPDGEHGMKYVPAHLATIDERKAENDYALRFHTKQVNHRQRAAVDIEKVLDAAEGDGSANYRAAKSAVESGE